MSIEEGDHTPKDAEEFKAPENQPGENKGIDVTDVYALDEHGSDLRKRANELREREKLLKGPALELYENVTKKLDHARDKASDSSADLDWVLDSQGYHPERWDNSLAYEAEKQFPKFLRVVIENEGRTAYRALQEYKSALRNFESQMSIEAGIPLIRRYTAEGDGSPSIHKEGLDKDINKLRGEVTEVNEELENAKWQDVPPKEEQAEDSK
ncbi:MAG: hypothetical protein NUV80_01945 [Candidatus Berkelbacteria bacterium]|nr:hypothetical protein [Candidatus Berkelbacteria bacterium]